MKIKCCSQYKKPDITFSASPIDLVGLGYFLVIMLSIIGLVVFGVGSALIENLSDGTFSEELKHCYESNSGRRKSGCFTNSSLTLYLAFFAAVWFVLPKFLNACGYLINYRLKIQMRCHECGKTEVVCDLPKDRGNLS